MADDKFSNWLNKQYILWRGETRAGVTDFAAFLGFPQPYVSNWLNGKFRPSTKNLPGLAARLGLEIYDALDLPRPTVDVLSALPPDVRSRFEEASFEANSKITEKGITRDSPEALEIIKEEFSKRGINFTFTE